MANEQQPKLSFKLGDYSNLPKSNIELGALYLAKTNDSGRLYYGLSSNELLPIIGIKTGDDIEVNAEGEVTVKYAEALKVSTGSVSHPVYFDGDGIPAICENLFLVANGSNYGTSDPSTLQPDLLQGSFQEGQLYFQIID